MSNAFTILLNPQQRMDYLRQVCKLIYGIDLPPEDCQSAYCPISLTSTPQELKPLLQERQNLLMRQVLEPVNVKAYDPASAPYSPDTNLHSSPAEVYMVDAGRVLSSRFFVGHDILPSSGFGVEAQIASATNRNAVLLRDAHVRVSRMQPPRSILLEYRHFERELLLFREVFEFLQQFDVGAGVRNVDSTPILLGFHKKTGGVVDLEALVQQTFPHLAYCYRGNVPILMLACVNPERMYENVDHAPTHFSFKAFELRHDRLPAYRLVVSCTQDGTATGAFLHVPTGDTRDFTFSSVNGPRVDYLPQMAADYLRRLLDEDADGIRLSADMFREVAMPEYFASQVPGEEGYMMVFNRQDGRPDAVVRFSKTLGHVAEIWQHGSEGNVWKKAA